MSEVYALETRLREPCKTKMRVWIKARIGGTIAALSTMADVRLATLHTAELETTVDAILARTGRQVGCATPLGLGKPVPLLNALYARVKADSQLHLSILTALSLEIPRASGDLERRFLEPFVRRVFEGVPELDYLRDLRRGGLPKN